MATAYPPIFINDYLREKLSLLLGPSNVSVDVPFFPTSPSTIEQLTTTAAINNESQLFAVYDRMSKMRRRAFPHIKSEQLLYYFYSLDVSSMIDSSQHISDLLDRGNESAEDLNSWIAKKIINGKYIKDNGDGSTREFLPVYFHDIKIYQLEETRDIVDFGTARTYAGNKIIIDYTYHAKGYNASSNGSYNDTSIV